MKNKNLAESDDESDKLCTLTTNINKFIKRMVKKTSSNSSKANIYSKYTKSDSKHTKN